MKIYAFGKPRMLREAGEGGALKLALSFLIVAGASVLGDAVTVIAMLFFPAVADLSTDAGMLFSLFSRVIVVAALLLLGRFAEHRSMRSLGVSRGLVFDAPVGFLIGGAMFSLTVALGAALGALRYEGRGTLTLGLGVLYVLAFVVQAGAEELTVRGYLLPVIARHTSPTVAVLLTSALFSLLHLSNPGFGILPAVNVFLAGAFFGFFVLRRGDLWGATMMHAAWNFFEGQIFGVPISGNVPTSALFRFASGEASEFFTGGAFGIEGSLVTTAVFAVGILVLLFVPGRDL